MITWDEPKRQANIANHGMDFVGADAVFDHPVVTWDDARLAYGEQRIILLGWLNGKVVQMKWPIPSVATPCISFLCARQPSMRHDTTSKPFPKSPEEIRAAIEQAPEWVDDPECPYNPNDPEAVRAFWAKATVRRPGQRGPQKTPTKVSTTLRLDPDVLDYFRAQGPGWQTRINEALKEWVKEHR